MAYTQSSPTQYELVALETQGKHFSRRRQVWMKIELFHVSDTHSNAHIKSFGDGHYSKQTVSLIKVKSRKQQAIVGSGLTCHEFICYCRTSAKKGKKQVRINEGYSSFCFSYYLCQRISREEIFGW